MDKLFAVYIMTNKPHGVLYIGMTDDLNRRVWEHREKVFRGFAARYGCDQLVWFENHDTRESAFTRERQMKAWKRSWKIELIEQLNPKWRNLGDQLL